ncbi:MAG TPA: hypothetical protein VF384_10175 [Planctomycetota bacterium]
MLRPLPRELITLGQPGDQILVLFPSPAVCTVTRMRRDASGETRPEVKYGSWSTAGETLSLTFDGKSAEYVWQEGALALDEEQHTLWQLVPRFDAPVGPLPALPLVDAAAVSGLFAERENASRPRGLFGWLAFAIMRGLAPLPWWLRAPIATAVALVSIVLFRVAFHPEAWASMAELGTALSGVAAAGLIGGGVPTLLFVPLRRLGYAGSLLNGVVGVLSYLSACAWAFDDFPANQRSLLIFLAVGLVFGLVVGHALLHPLAKISAARERQ